MMFKKCIALAIAFMMIGLIGTPQIKAKTQEQQEAIVRITEELSAGKITYAEYM